MNISQLRSKLLRYVPDASQLTLQDIKECNWKTQKCVFSGILLSCERYREYAEMINSINEARSRNLSFLRSQSESREERKQFEMDYRYNFYKIIAKVCTDLSWPPSLEPFSNPIALLMDTIDYKLNAISFLLEYAYPQSQQTTPVTPLKRIPTSIVPILETSNSIQSNNVQVNQEFNQEKIAIKVNNEEDYNLKSVREMPSRTYQINTLASVSSELNDIEVIAKANEILKSHNEQLLKQCKLLQNSILSRNDAEGRMDLLFRDMQQMVDDLAGAGGGESWKGGATTAAEKDADSATVTSSITSQSIRSKSASRAAGVTATLAARLGSQRPSRVTTTATVTTDVEKDKERRGHKDGVIDSNASIGSAVSNRPQGNNKKSWTQISHRVRDIHGKWTEAKRDAHALVFGSVSVNKETVRSFCRQPQNGNSLSPTLKGTANTARGNAATTANTANTARSRKGREGLGGATHWNDNIDISSHRDNAGGLKQTSSQLSEQPTYDCNRISMLKLLGLRPPLSGEQRPADGAPGVDESFSGVALDVNRVHALQTELYEFSKCAVDVTHSGSNIFSDSAAQFLHAPPPPPGTSRSSASTIKSSTLQEANHNIDFIKNIEKLRATSRKLHLHLACLAPVASLQANDSLSSSRSGLDCFIDLSFDSIGKKYSTELQAAADRAKSEQVIMLKNLERAELCVKMWCQKVSCITMSLSALSKRVNDNIKSFGVECQTFSKDIVTIVNSFKEAEKSRIHLPLDAFQHDGVGTNSISSTGVSTLVCPLDPLMRGFMGEDIATLLNTLKLNLESILNLKEFFVNTRKKFQMDISEELKSISKISDNIFDLLKYSTTG